MAGNVSYQLVNKTGSQLNLVATVQNPPNWLPAPPTTIAAGGNPSLDTNEDQDPGTVVFGYSLGDPLTQFWVISNGTQVIQFAPNGHSIDINVSGDSEDGFLVTLTYQ